MSQINRFAKPSVDREQLLTAAQALAEVRRRIPWSLSSLYRHSANGGFVRPVVVCGQKFWPPDEVRAWIAARFAERGAERKAAA